MAIAVSVPMRLRVDPAALYERTPDIEEALVAALQRALDNSRENVLANRKGAIQLTVESPSITWSGDGLAEVPEGIRSDLAARLTDLIEQTTRGAGIHNPGVGAKRTRRPWFIRNSVSFHVRVGDLLAYFQGFSAAAGGEDLEALYHDQLDEVRWASAWIVQVNETYALPDLVPLVAKRADELSKRRANESIVYGYTTSEEHRLDLAILDRDGVTMAHLPDLAAHNLRLVDGMDDDAVLYEGAWLLFIRITLPEINLEGVGFLSEEIEVPVTYAALDFLVNADSFERIYGVAWSDWLAELGDQPVTLRLQPVEALQRVHYETLRYLLLDDVAYRIPSEAYYFGGLHLLNRTTIAGLPAAARAEATYYSNGDTLSLDDAKRDGYWEQFWAGAYIYAIFQPTKDELDIIRYRPEARVLASEILAFLKEDQDELEWPYRLEDFINKHYVNDRRVKAFEFLLEQLELALLLVPFFDAIIASENFALLNKVANLASGTRYGDYEVVRRAHAVLTEWHVGYLRHSYDVASQEMLLWQDEDYRVGKNEVLGDYWTHYTVSQEVPRIKEDKRADLEKAIQEEAVEAFKRILTGAETRELSQEELMEEIVKAAIPRAGITEDDIETVDLERSVRLLRLSEGYTEGFQRFYVTYDYVERIDGGEWVPVPDSQTTTTEAKLEEMLTFWAIGHSAAVIEAFAIGLTVVGLLFVAWEIGLIALLVELGGGAAVVGVSIGVAELIYLLRVIFTDATLSIEGVLLAALDGYLFAVGFRFGAFVGRALAKSIGTETVQAIVRGWLVERLAVGSVGGATSMALVTFSHGAIKVMTGTGDWPTLGEYVTNMAVGAVLGVVIEYSAGFVGIALKSSSPSALRTAADAAGALQEAGVSSVRWAALSLESFRNFRGAMRRALDTALADGAATSMGDRILQITEAMGGRLFVFRRVLELADFPLSRSAISGLEKFLIGSEAGLDDAATIAFLRGLAKNSAQAQRVMEAFNLLETAAIEKIVAEAELANFATSSSYLTLLENLGAGRAWPLLDSVFGVKVADAEAFATRLVKRPVGDQTAAVDTLLRPAQTITPEGVLQGLEKRGSLAATVLAQLDHLYDYLPTASADEALINVSAANAASYMEFLRGLGSSNLGRLNTEGIMVPLGGAPRVVAFARAGYLARVRSLVMPSGNPAEVITEMERLFGLQPGLTPIQLRDLVDQLISARLTSPGAIETAADVAAQAGLPATLRTDQIVALLGALVKDNVVLPVAEVMLQVPTSHAIAGISVPGPGVAAPDVLFTTVGGQHIGREAVSSTLTTPGAGLTPQAALQRNVVSNIVDKIETYAPGGTANQPGRSFVRREIDLQIREAAPATGINVGPLIDQPFIDAVMVDVAADATAGGFLANISTIRFYGPSGNLMFIWP